MNFTLAFQISYLYFDNLFAFQNIKGQDNQHLLKTYTDSLQQFMIYNIDPYEKRNFVQKGLKFGQSYYEFLISIGNFFTHTRTIKVDEKMCPLEDHLERVIFLAIIQKLQEKTKNTSVLAQLFDRIRPAVQAYSGKQAKEVTAMEEIILKEANENLMFANKSTVSPVLNAYAVCFLRGLLNKKEDKGYFSRKPITYNAKDFEEIKKVTKVQINYINYEEEKDLTKEFKRPYTEDGYIVYAKKKYYFLYVRGKKAYKKDHDLDEIKVLKNSEISSKDIEKLFQKQPENELEKNQPSNLFPDEVECTFCHKPQSQFDCLSWNYSYICALCLVDPSNQTSYIPAQIIQKFCRQRQIKYNYYDIICPECQGVARLWNYNPAEKPKKFKCQNCSKIICIDHSCNIFSCFCMCSNCKTTTIFIDKMSLNYCQKCKNRYCFKCNVKSKKFCKCVCKQCLGEDSEKHMCTKKCHQCLNSLTKLKNCRCGLFICYGCYYRNYANMKKTDQFHCIIRDFE